MGTEDHNLLPAWAPRVAKRIIKRLYEADARGIYDEDLIDDVGYSLLARCQSFIDAVDAVRGEVRCPKCSRSILHKARKEELLKCSCGWELTWGEYFKTIQHKQLSGAEPVLAQFRAFIRAFSAARTSRQKVHHIDCLIHGFHWYYSDNSPTRPVAVNLIEGRLRDVVSFLENLTNGERSTPRMRQNREEWDRNIQVYHSWYEPK